MTFAPFAADGYKWGHYFMNPANMTSNYANLTPRSNRLFKGLEGYNRKLLWVGIQGTISEIEKMYNDTFFNRPKAEVMAEIKEEMDAAFGVGVLTYDHWAALHDYGRLPITIKSLPEGSLVPMRVPVFTIRETAEEHAWFSQFLETVLSANSWKTATNATIAYLYKQLLTDYAVQTGSPLEGIPFQAHDFSSRGMSGIEDAGRAGIGHLAAGFLGSDSFAAISYAKNNYDYKVGVSGPLMLTVPATEHAVSSVNIRTIQRTLQNNPAQLLDWQLKTGWGDSLQIAEMLFVRKMLTENYPTGLFSYVADTYDYWFLITKIVPFLKDEIMARQANAVGLQKFVVRPDSGDPVKIVAGYASSEYRRDRCGVAYPLSAWDGAVFIGGVCPIPEHEIKGSIECLWDTFGGTVTSKGYKLLDEHIGLIYGDSITPERAQAILERLKIKGFASGCVVFGVGSFTYQYNTRDTFGFAMKATWTVVNSQPLDIYKDPKTGDALKKSAKGLLRVEVEDGTFVLYDQQTEEQEAQGALEVIFSDGAWVKRTTVDEIRSRVV